MIINNHTTDSPPPPYPGDAEPLDVDDKAQQEAYSRFEAEREWHAHTTATVYERIKPESLMYSPFRKRIYEK